MKILTISGSPRKNGGTSGIISALIREIEQSGISPLKIRSISLAQEKIRPCKACGKCIKEGFCVRHSDDWADISRQMLKSDLIIIASPVYFHDVNGPVKNLIDRSYSLWHKKQLKGKKVIPVAVCHEVGEDRTLETLKIWAQAHDMKLLKSVSGRGAKDAAKDAEVLASVQDVVKSLTGETTPDSAV